MFTNLRTIVRKRFTPNTGRKNTVQKKVFFAISKRQKFVVAVIFLSLGLFFSDFLFGKSGMFFSLFLASVTELFLIWAMYKDIDDQFSYHVFILPFLYSLSFGLFYFLVPQRVISGIILTTLYGVGLYSLFLSQNIFVVASIRTIQLLSGARIVSFILSLVSYFFLTDIVYSLHTSIFVTIGIIFLFTFLLVMHSVWIYTLEAKIATYLYWVSGVTVCLFELSTILWFWPSTPTILALFLTGFFYIVLGLSHVWFDRRLFRNILWEYVWVGFAVLFIFLVSTNWRGLNP